MNKTISFWVSGIPKGQPRPKAFARKFGTQWKARVYDPGTAEEWKGRIAEAAKMHIPAEPFNCALSLILDFHMPRPKSHFKASGALKKINRWHTSKPDTDNLQKAVMDALTQLGFWRDDSLVCRIRCSKEYANGTTGAQITMWEVSE